MLVTVRVYLTAAPAAAMIAATIAPESCGETRVTIYVRFPWAKT